MDIPQPPPCPPKLKEYLLLLREACLTNRPIQGRATTVDEHEGEGTVVNADDCSPCP